MDPAHVIRRIFAYGAFAVGAFWLFLAGWTIWAGGVVWEWNDLGLAFVFWYVVFAIPFLIGGWWLLRLKL
jgi:hypothetical protein